jgi:phage repressor protein C with HTH and peptisase S24 domain
MLPGQYTKYDETGKPIGTDTGTGYLTQQFGPQDLQAGLAPNYNFMLQQGQNLNQRQANLSGGAISGNTLQGLERYTQDYANNAYQNAFNNFQSQRTGIYNTLAGIAGLGQKAQESTSQAGQNATTAAAQLGVGSAAANAAGLTGASNAISGGLQNYQQNQILQAVLGQNQNVAQQTPGYFG